MGVIEICTFTAAGDVDALRAADARVQTEFAYRQPGLLRRTTARGDDGRWCVITLWRSDDDAAGAAAAEDNDPVATDFWSLVDLNTVQVQRFTTLE
jgi:hypothetical protein